MVFCCGSPNGLRQWLIVKQQASNMSTAECQSQVARPALATSFHCALVSSTIKWERKNDILAQSTCILLRWLWDEHINRQIPNQAKTLYWSWKASQRSEQSTDIVAFHNGHPPNCKCFRIAPQTETVLSNRSKTRRSHAASLQRRLICVSKLSNNLSYLIIFLYTHPFFPHTV